MSVSNKKIEWDKKWTDILSENMRYDLAECWPAELLELEEDADKLTNGNLGTSIRHLNMHLQQFSH